ncbi:Periplasmic aromatic aldehyde oxidoreductase, FAD binding subunit YagS [Arcticibacter svalbardensis MN12-7]|uniref:Periplasmic aromatic aldehyde oxidoreductase, FAD binding subunit YagS n=1 Tax=Arcticibacter svalbardensis MN12-7 TaxID=1150600 RepID=R9GVF8_9SPHI|nr:xanthine dehydrogenase family protein subunit M [Arcticibacter svalbardensis]EOR95832.1 Periplasmic aromatic aldehyde oxidoreductase, FAD binding subunit YagS [Arcticibacter svalbardensis MN12-7]
MNQFQYVRPAETSGAIKSVALDANAHFLAGGTNLVDLMKMGIVTPERLVDINNLPLKKIENIQGHLRIGALVTNTQVAENKFVKENFPLLSMAINAGASPQLRNMATTGGNLLQRTRCPYFFDTTMPCNKRVPGSGCGALEGYNRMHAIFGASDKCIAVNPSDMNVALTALNAFVHVSGPKAARTIPFADFHRLPGDHPEQDTTLQKNELITSIDIPTAPFSKNVHYLKVRDRSSYAFALVSAAVALHIENNTIKDVRLAMGGVAHKPWRLTATETFLKGKTVSEDTFKQAAQIAMEGAKAYEHNKFKLKLAPNTLIQALKTASGLTV